MPYTLTTDSYIESITMTTRKLEMGFQKFDNSHVAYAEIIRFSALVRLSKTGGGNIPWKLLGLRPRSLHAASAKWKASCMLSPSEQ